MRTLVVGHFIQGSLDLSYAQCLGNLGCDVTTFDYLEEYGNISPLTKNRYTNRVLCNLFYAVENKKFMKSALSNNPELILIFKGDFIFPSTLINIKAATRAVIFNFNPDNPFNPGRGSSNSFIRNSIPLYDCYFTWGQFLIPILKRAGARRVEYLPFGYDPSVIRPLEVTEEEENVYRSEIAFIGTWDRERENYLEPLAGYDLAIWGNSWEKLRSNSKLRRKWRRAGNLGKEMGKVCAASKIVLNLIRRQNGDAHNMKTFEIPACRGFMLATRTKEQSEFFSEGKEIECFESPEELKTKIDYFLGGKDSLIDGFRSLAHDKVKIHTYSERTKKLLQIYRLFADK